MIFLYWVKNILLPVSENPPKQDAFNACGRSLDTPSLCTDKVEECRETDCMFKRMKERAHRMSGRGRAALLAWFAIIASRVVGSNAPVHWSKSERKNYLDSLAEISKKIVAQGRPGVHTPLIEKLAARAEQSANSCLWFRTYLVGGHKASADLRSFP